MTGKPRTLILTIDMGEYRQYLAGSGDSFIMGRPAIRAIRDANWMDRLVGWICRNKAAAQDLRSASQAAFDRGMEFGIGINAEQYNKLLGALNIPSSAVSGFGMLTLIPTANGSTTKDLTV